MDCVYKVHEYYGSYTGNAYLERESNTGTVSAFFPDGVAFIDYKAMSGQPLSYTVKTARGEIIAIDRWDETHESKYTAAISAIEAACSAVYRYDSRTTCMIGDKLASEVIESLQAAEKRRLKELAERSAEE